jgi:hypothetical protein
MDEKKRKEIEARLLQLFTKSEKGPHSDASAKTSATVVKVIRRRKGKSDLQIA